MSAITFKTTDSSVRYIGTKLFLKAGLLKDIFQECELESTIEVPFTSAMVKDFLLYVEYDNMIDIKNAIGSRTTVNEVIQFGMNVASVADFLNYERDPKDWCLEEMLDRFLPLGIIDDMGDYLQDNSIEFAGNWQAPIIGFKWLLEGQQTSVNC